jgi:ribosomal protein S14
MVKLKLNLKRTNPVVYVSDQTRVWVSNRYLPAAHQLKKQCLQTGRGRAYNRLSRLNRSPFLARLRANHVWGLQKSSW